MVCNCDLKQPHIPANDFVALGECKVRSPVGTSRAFNYWWKNHYFITSVNYFLSCLKLERSKLNILARTMEMHTGIECSISKYLWRAKDYGRQGGTDINTTQSSPSSNTTPCVYLFFLLCLWTEKTSLLSSFIFGLCVHLHSYFKTNSRVSSFTNTFLNTPSFVPWWDHSILAHVTLYCTSWFTYMLNLLNILLISDSPAKARIVFYLSH